MASDDKNEKSGPAEKMLRFCEEIGNLKHLDRKGWVMRRVPAPERVTVCMSAVSPFHVTSFLDTGSYVSNGDAGYDYGSSSQL